MGRKASIDIGTNSTRLLIAEVSDAGTIVPLHMEERITRLGDGLDNEKRMSHDAMERVIDVLREYKRLGTENGVDEFRVFATSATRDAVNRNEFLAMISRIGLRCRVLSGEQEAMLSYLGVMSDVEKDGHYLVCDIGGGSTEFILGDRHSISYKKSVDVGSRRLHHRFLLSNPPKKAEIERLENFLSETLRRSLDVLLPPDSMCVSVGGTATTLGMMAGGIDIAMAEKVHKYVLTVAALEDIIEKLATLSIERRKNLKGLNPGRADVILSGALVLKGIMDFFKLTETRISIRDLLFGVMLKWD